MSRIVLGLGLFGSIVAFTLLGDSSRAEEAETGSPASPPDAGASAAADAEEDIPGLIEQLGDPLFERRAEAMRRLGALGEKAVKHLREAVDGAESEEVRWRAEQLLLRLEGQGPRSLGSSGTQPAPEGKRGALAWDSSDIMRSLRGMMEDLQRRTEELRHRVRGLDALSPSHPLRGVEAGALRLEPQGRGKVRLIVRPDGSGGDALAERRYEGESLEAILAQNPKLREHPDLAALQSQMKHSFWHWPDMWSDFHFDLPDGGPGAGPSFGLNLRRGGSSQNVEVRQDENGARVRIVTREPGGEERVQEFSGKSLAEIKEKHPEAAPYLDGFQIRIRGPQIFWGDEGSTMPEFRMPPPTFRLDRDEQPDPPEAPRGRKAFGLLIGPVPSALRVHLGLGDTEGIWIRNVLPDSAAAAVGLTAHDILLSVDGERIDSLEEASELLAAKAEPGTPVRLEIFRRGERMTLSP